MKFSSSARVVFALFVSAQSFSPPMHRLVSAARFGANSPILRASSSKVNSFTPMPEVSFAVTDTAPSAFKGDLVVFPVSAPAKDAPKDALASLSSEAAAADGSSFLNGALADLITQEEFKGKAGDVATIRVAGAGTKVAALVGVGAPSTSGSSGSGGVEGSLGKAMAKLAKSHKTTETMAVVLPDATSPEKVAAAMASALYVDNRFRTGDNIVKPLNLKSVTFIGSGLSADQVPHALASVEGVNLCKDLVNAPPNIVTPQSLAETAETIAADHPNMNCKVLLEADIEALGMGAYLGVAQGSKPGEGSPRFIHLSYTPPNFDASTQKRVALVGKGLTFDSGGYNLKAGAGSMIELMKFDMGGSAAVLGAAKTIALMQPEDVAVDFIVAACENMVSDRAMRPGDVLTASNGLTIEVLNTDAEGRLTLADALVYAEKLQPTSIIDIATLTGACMVSLGDKMGGLWSDDEELAAALAASSKASGDKLWRMPMGKEEYNKRCKSKIADMTNIGGSPGAITAALFLRNFVTEATPWAHLDIAGPVWDKESGATGFGVRVLVDYVNSQGGQVK